jgi:hypothetical protein
MAVILPLPSVPAFGFEWGSCNANQTRCHHRRNHSLTAADVQAEEVSYWATNFFKVLGAIVPLVGIGRIFDAVFLSEDGEQVLSIIRGIMELSGLGIVALGIDIAITIGRAVAISLNKHNAEPQTT